MPLLGPDCPVEVSSGGRRACATQFIDFRDSVCTGASHGSCCSFSGGVHLWVPYWKDWLMFVLCPINVCSTLLSRVTPQHSRSHLSLQPRSVCYWNHISEMAARLALRAAKIGVTQTSYSLLFDCYRHLIPPARTSHYSTSAAFLDIFGTFLSKWELTQCQWGQVFGLLVLFSFSPCWRGTAVPSAQTQPSAPSQRSVAFLCVRGMCILNSCSPMGSYFLLEYVRRTPSALLHIFQASTYLFTCTIVVYRCTNINIYIHTHTCGFFWCKTVS